MREAVEAEKFRYSQQIESLNDTLEKKEKDRAKLEQRAQQTSEERASLLAKQKELQWEKD